MGSACLAVPDASGATIALDLTVNRQSYRYVWCRLVRLRSTRARDSEATC